MKRVQIFGLLLLALSLALPFPAQASRPVPRTLEGCVINGIFFSVYKGAKTETGKRDLAYRIRVQNLDLSPYEGRKIRLSGYLLPGDRFTPSPHGLKVLGPCDRHSRDAITQGAR
jgi:hypothetical protein